MDPLSSETLRGTWGTVLLPINADDTIDYGRLALELDALIHSDLAGIYSNGTAGEFHTQTEAEFDQVNSLVAEKAAKHRFPFQLGASHPVAQTSLERVRRTRQLHPSAIQVILPDWLPVGHDEAVAFLARLAEAAAPVKLVLYNPPHAKRVLRIDELARLHAAVPGLIGLKVGDGPASWYAAVRRQLAGLAVFVPGHHLATGVLAGAQGSYSNIACLSPTGAARWHRLVHTAPLAALEIERRLLAFFQEHLSPLAARGFSGAALDKLLCVLGGWTDVGLRLRWPYQSVAPEIADRLRPVVRAAVPELFEPV